jgi:hypothetical protein
VNVRITPRGTPNRTNLYGGIETVRSDGTWLVLYRTHGPVVLPMRQVAEIALDDEPGDWW